jgi:trans-aconitate 2-methyltransferase
MHQGRVAGSTWDPAQYGIFADHRLRPAMELLERVPLSAPRLIYDLGCGTGEITGIMANRWPGARVIGVDNSPQMLAKAAAVSDEIAWIEADVAGWQPDGAPDLIYSNATLQWLDDHDALIPRLFGLLAPGGCLAVQMPMSWDLPSHRLMRETLAHGGPGGAPIGPATLREALDHVWVADAAHYFDLLSPNTRSLDIWETEYLQVLEGENPVLDWVSGTGLRPVLNGLADADRAVFLASYAAALLEAYPRRSNGQTLYPFRRLFMVATRA